MDSMTNPENVTASAGRDDAITSTVSPRPWRVYLPEDEDNPGTFGTARILDANGNIVVSMQLGQDCYDIPVAALIVEAVNALDAVHALSIKLYGPLRKAEDERDSLRKERDRLRDIVSRLADTLQSIIDAAEGRGMGRLDEGLVREARAAIGEDEPTPPYIMEGDRKTVVLHGRTAQTPDGEMHKVIREARAAIGEDKP